MVRYQYQDIYGEGCDECDWYVMQNIRIVSVRKVNHFMGMDVQNMDNVLGVSNVQVS